MPTILDAAGVRAPDTIDGIRQHPIEGGAEGMTVTEGGRFDGGGFGKGGTGTPVAFLEHRYDPPFAFTGTLAKLTFNLEPPQLTAEQQQVMQAMSQRNNRASE